MSKRVKKGKNAQKKKHNKGTGVRSSSVSVAQQRATYEEEEPRAELGAGVRVRSKGTTMPLGVRIMVGLMAFTMLTMMGVVSYSSLNDFDIVEWLTGEDVAPGTASKTSSASAMTASQRAAIDATNKFDGFFVVDKDSGITLTDVNSDRQDTDTYAVTKKYQKDADKKRDDILKADKKKIDKLKKKKDAREEAKKNNPFTKFSEGIGKLRDEVAALFTNTWDGLSGNNRADDGTTDASDDAASETDEAVDSGETTDYNDEGDGKSDEDGKTDGKGKDKPASATKPLSEVVADASGLNTSKPSGKQTLSEKLNEANGL